MADDNGNMPTTGQVIHANDILHNYVTNTTFNDTIGNINTILDNINGEVV